MTSQYSTWEQVKAKRRAIDPDFDNPERLAEARADRVAGEMGYHLGQMREAAGMSQADVAEELRVPVEQIVRMEDGDRDLLEIPRIAEYVAALGGHLRLVADLWRTTTTLVDYTEAPVASAQRDVA